MFASLLPGFRQLRAPLISGSLLLCALALFLHNALSGIIETDRRSDFLTTLIHWIGRPGLTAAALLAAYLVGSMMTASIRFLVWGFNINSIARIIQRSLPKNGQPAERLSSSGPSFPSFEWFQFLTAYKRKPASSRWSPPPLFPFSSDSFERLLLHLTFFESKQPTPTGLQHSWRLYNLLQEPLNDGARRLLLANAELYAEFDRNQSEAELRDSLLLPIPLLTLALVLNSSLSGAAIIGIFAAVVVILSFMFVQARVLDRTGYSVVLYAVADGVISLPSMDQAVNSAPTSHE